MPPTIHFDVSQVDCSKIVADKDAIRKMNPQRFEMEQLDAIVHVDHEKRICIGYRDVRPDEFWVRGHMPGYPIMPGVMLCESAAQLCSYYTAIIDLCQGDFIGFGGMESVRFRSPVHIGDRVIFVAKATRLHRRQTIFSVQGFVGNTMVFHADIVGVPLMKKAEG